MTAIFSIKYNYISLLFIVADKTLGQGFGVLQAVVVGRSRSAADAHVMHLINKYVITTKGGELC